MSEQVGDLVLRYQSRATLAGLAVPFKDDEKLVIQAWIQDQRLAAAPDKVNWLPLMNGRTPFFAHEFESLIKGKEGQLILDCVTPVSTNEDLQELFPELKDQGLRFLFTGLQKSQINIFPASGPLLMDRSRPQYLWVVRTKNEDSIAVKPATLSDILSALLRTWNEQRALMKLARERLCDILAKCLTF